MTTTQDLNLDHWVAAARGEESDWGALAAEPVGLDATWVDDPAGLWLRPPDAPDDLVLLAVHGGGFVSGSVQTHRRMFGHLALASGLRTFVVEYGLVPDHVFPSQIDTVTAAYRWLLSGGARRIALVGDSCGALLALSLAVRARSDGLEPPAALLLISAWMDLLATGESYDGGGDPFFTREMVRDLGAAYLAGVDPHDPLASPLDADPSGLPPTYLQVGAEEALLDDSRLLARHLAAAGVDVRLDEFPGQVHSFQMSAGRAGVADEAIGRAGTWLRSTLVP